MRYAATFLTLLALYGCAVPKEDPPEGNSRQPELFSDNRATDDGTYLARIDPLGGQWRVVRIGESDFTRFKAWVNFSAGGFLNHGAGCAGAYPAFYRLEDERIAVTRLEPIRVGKCADTAELANRSAVARASAAQSERRMARFIDQLSAWNCVGDTLTLTAVDGARATLTKPVEPDPEIAGRWQIKSIGDAPLVTERGLATLSLGMGRIGASADCNSIGGQFTIPSPGRIAVTDMMSTLIGCAPEDAAENAQISRALTQARGYRLVDERLIFTGGPGMVMRRPPAPDRRLTGEYEACGNTPLGAYHEGPITLAITRNSMRDNAGCSARYVAQGPDLGLQLDGTPACGDVAPAYVPGKPVGIGGEISMLAVTRPNGFGFNEQGQLIFRTNRGLLTMCRKAAPPPFGQ